jgi:hypothetical protein
MRDWPHNLLKTRNIQYIKNLVRVCVQPTKKKKNYKDLAFLDTN